MPWGRAGLDVVVTTDGDRDVFLVFMGASTGLEPVGADTSSCDLKCRVTFAQRKGTRDTKVL